MLLRITNFYKRANSSAEQEQERPKLRVVGSNPIWRNKTQEDYSMVKKVYAYKTACNGTVHDSLSQETEKLRSQGFSIFGINDGESFRNPAPGVLLHRIVEIFYE